MAQYCAITWVILIAQYFFGISARWKSDWLGLNLVKGIVIRLYIGKSKVTFGKENYKWERDVKHQTQKHSTLAGLAQLPKTKSIAKEENLNHGDGPQTINPKLFALRSFSVEVNQPIIFPPISQKAQFPA
ncbi:MAG: hypothetical protein ACK44D_02540 [Bacteroidia bacterium]